MNRIRSWVFPSHRQQPIVARGVILVGGAKGHIQGSAFTYPGRFNVYVPDLDLGLTCSLRDIESLSSEAESWLLGFLEGQVPDALAEQWFDDDQTEQYADTVERFIHTGEMP